MPSAKNNTMLIIFMERMVLYFIFDCVTIKKLPIDVTNEDEWKQ